MKTIFLQDFRGRETGEQFFKKGDVVDGERFAFLAERGIVEIIPDEPPESAPPKPARKSKAKK